MKFMNTVGKGKGLDLQWCEQWKCLNERFVHFPLLSVVFYYDPSECQSILQKQCKNIEIIYVKLN